MIDKRLKNLRSEKKLLQKDVAKHLNISTSAYGYYEQGKRNPDVEMIEKLADFYECSTDYLIGRSNNKNDISISKYNSDCSKYINYIKEKIYKNLLNEGIIKENEPIAKYMVEKILKHGLETALEILKLEKKIEDYNK